MCERLDGFEGKLVGYEARLQKLEEGTLELQNLDYANEQEEPTDGPEEWVRANQPANEQDEPIDGSEEEASKLSISE